MLLRRETREWQKGKGEERLLFKAFKQMSMYKVRYIFVTITRTTLTKKIRFSKTLIILKKPACVWNFPTDLNQKVVNGITCLK